MRLDDDSPLTSEPTTIQEANSRVGSPEVNLLIPASNTGGVEVIVEPTEPIQDGKPSPERSETGTSIVKTPSPLGEHGDGTESDAKTDANGAESSKDAQAKDDAKDKDADAKDADAKDTNGDKSNKGNSESQRGRKKKKGKK